MPFINGQKMACAPCIRGHRSTKCNHFNERVMVPVRKPGRPLSTCPCPPGKPCACGGVRVAIPRKQQCGCGPEKGEEASLAEQQQQAPSPVVETPTSPSRPSFRVNKSGSMSRTNGRKQSFDPANLGRIDPMSVNLVMPQNVGLDNTNGVSMAPNNIVAQMSPPVTSGFVTNIGYVASGPPNGFGHPRNLAYTAPLAYTMSPQYTQTHHLPPQGEIKREDSIHSSQIQDLGLSIQTTPPSNGTKSCCSPAVDEPQQQRQPVNLGPSLMPSSNGGMSNGGSCCDGGGKKDSPVSPTNGMPPVVAQAGYDKEFMTTRFQSPTIPGHGLKTHENFQTQIPFPTVYTYPGDYGSWQHPVNQAIWQQIASQPSMSLGPADTTIANNPPTNGGTSTANGELGGGGAGTTHECACVDCKCIGCLAHPFNDQMFQYVNNAYMDSPTNTNGSNGGHAVAGADLSQTTTNGVPPPESPPDQAQTPSDASGFSSDEQQLSLSTVDYFFVNLPLRDDGTCGGDLHACPCGDDCQCIGCLVHNAPLPEQ
ncbi:hypothetical protein B0H66DRAFT_291817 [Apodospora peruviana]|uniref:Copper-fist domain-containing protein n=1 Tax=Apodospora peruviana TaxID=516989 RepID=A0AAE0I144_9PEZI|nr:hypothetical protein B0H66DRAFT_291817 [Apodospora peruviana]